MHKKQMQRIHTQYALQWYLKIGHHQGSLNLRAIISELSVKPLMLHRWLTGKATAPAFKLQQIKLEAIAPYRRKVRKKALGSRLREKDIESALQIYAWKTQLFDAMNMHGKRRFCCRLKKTYR